MSAFSRRLPLRSVLSVWDRPRFVKLRDGVSNFKPVKFLIQVADDYKNVAKDALVDAKSRPWRSSVILAGATAAYFAWQNNPPERSFVDALLESNNDLIQVPATARNSVSECFLVSAHRFRSADRLKYVNIGLCSLMLHEDFNRSCDVYQAHCKYLLPSVFTFYDRLVDVGVFNRWIRLERAMENFDVNLVD
ncbi:putative Uncharacterized protein C19orf52 [Hypsibius exemplaris]|uniref:Mitochondrial import inner membrane translocase subunit Tim29 n=1 Tax=Hypsibius exemplaris TaxID=2072580 RepID=A0A1W0X2L9_HYPEX|nr:putative Uncharacterized protein C19orf52 [Hypsibius exemplaris]